MLIIQSPARPSAIRHALADILTPDVVGLSIASAYATLEGSRIVYDAVEAAAGAKSLQAMPKEIVTSFDYGLTQPQALAFWLKAPNCQVFVAGAEQLKKGSLQPGESAFHPKFYAFTRANARANLLVGSANMTGRGLSANCEAATASLDVPAADVAQALDLVRRETVPLDAALLKLYEVQRKKTPPPRPLAKEVEPLPEPVPGKGSDYPWFWNELVAAHIVPASEQHMWVQVQGTSGGSHSQIEIARGSHQFFGFDFNDYGFPDAKTIGQPLIVFGGKEWPRKPIAWHGNNEMTRMNLPSPKKTHVPYEKSALLFRRLPQAAAEDAFEMVVAKWDSDLAKGWRGASAANGKLYRVGENTARLTGFI